jgi:hypothetical protein
MEAGLFRRPKLTLSCSAEGKEGRKFKVQYTYVNSFGLTIFALNAYVRACTKDLDSLSIHCIQIEHGS